MTERFFQDLVGRLDSATPEDIGSTIVELFTEAFGTSSAEAWVIDIGATDLTSVMRPEEHVPVAGSRLGAVYEDARVAVEDATVMVPLSVRGLPFGVLTVTGGAVPDDVIAVAGTVIGNALRATERHSDFIDVLRGGEDLGLSATIQRSVLPDRALSHELVELTARIEPAYEAAGDAFDYAALAQRLDLALFDAVGHGTRAALLSSAAVGSYRYARRRLDRLSDMHGLIDGVIADQGRPADFVTGIVSRLELETGTLEGFNAGHLPPIIVELDGGVREIAVERPGLPLGLRGAAARFSTRLVPGELLVMYSDGVSEAGTDVVTPWGRERLYEYVAQAVRAHSSLRDICNGLLHEVLGYAGPRLRDDATVVMARLR